MYIYVMLLGMKSLGILGLANVPIQTAAYAIYGLLLPGIPREGSA